MPADLNRSLERGVEILRAFRPGSTLLGNSELAERTGLAPATVSRLTRTLVGSGLLEHVPAARAYRLAAPVLSLAHAMHSGSELLQLAAPRMRQLAEKLRINVGLARADRAEMVYLESIRYNRRASLRKVVSGQRVPVELTSLGRAWLAVAAPDVRERLFDELAVRRNDWPQLLPDIEHAIAHVHSAGWCAASWQPEIVALAMPLRLDGEAGHALNVSVSTSQPVGDVAQELGGPLLRLGHEIEQLMASR